MTAGTEGTRVLRFTDEAMSTLRKLAEDRPELWQDPKTDFIRELTALGVTDPTEDTGLTALGEMHMPIPETGPGKRLQQVDEYSLIFLDNIPGLAAEHLSDPNMLAWMSCVPLLEFGIRRWPPTRNADPTAWVSQHFLARTGREITDASVAGRCLWIAEISRRAARELNSLDEQKVLEQFGKNPEHYHQCTGFQIMRSRSILKEFVFQMMTGAQGISREGIRELAREANRAAGARLLDPLGGKKIREIMDEATDSLMSQKRFVSDRRKLRVKPTLKVLSLGAGVQSTVMALMADRGYLGMEKPDFAIFADTGWEPKAVYQNLEWLERELSYPVVRVQNGNIKESILSGTNPEGWEFIDMPLFVMDEKGNRSIATRQCTRVYKLDPIHQELRERLGMERGRRAAIDIKVEMWLGITLDEADRRKPSRKEWIENRYPLIEKDLSRSQLYLWFRENHPERNLPKSACIGCPYHTDAMWAEMKLNSPEEFQDAVAVDWSLRNVPQCRGSLKGAGFLHRTMIPLSEVDFSQTRTETEAMRAECEGICGV